jgi:sulfur carrier protein ThiS
MSKDSGKLKLFRFVINKGIVVKQLLEELGLSEGFFAVFVDGKKANLDSYVDEGSLVIVLPRIAGG